MAPAILILILLLHVCFLNFNPSNGTTFPKFSSIIIFGDSTVDTGNNNYIQTMLRSDHPPYGQSFPGRIATGRFSDGKLVPDYVASFLGIKDTVPPFLDPNLTDEELRTGVSFASAGSGYDYRTADISRSIPVPEQPKYLSMYLKRLEGIVGSEEAQNITSSAIVVISAGTNDLVFNYYDIPTRRFQFPISEYQNYLLKKLNDLVKNLYKLGYRWIVVAGLPPVGCLPIQMSVEPRIPSRTCIEKQNKDAQDYNQKLLTMLAQLEKSLSGSNILYADLYTPIDDMINNPTKYGIVETGRGCCGTGILETGPYCSQMSPVCQNASQYLFWDSIHPSGSAYRFISQAIENQVLGQLS